MQYRFHATEQRQQGAGGEAETVESRQRIEQHIIEAQSLRYVRENLVNVGDDIAVGQGDALGIALGS